MRCVSSFSHLLQLVLTPRAQVKTTDKTTPSARRSIERIERPVVEIKQTPVLPLHKSPNSTPDNQKSVRLLSSSSLFSFVVDIQAQMIQLIQEEIEDDDEMVRPALLFAAAQAHYTGIFGDMDAMVTDPRDRRRFNKVVSAEIVKTVQGLEAGVEIIGRRSVRTRRPSIKETFKRIEDDEKWIAKDIYS